MGCDIHAHIEQKINGFWEHYTQLDLNRNYEFFRALTNNAVRPVDWNDFEHSSLKMPEPRGIPHATSKPVQFHLRDWGTSIHSRGWIGKEEMVRIEKAFYNPKEFKPFLGYFYGNTISSLPDFVEDVRMVFWFDN